MSTTTERRGCVTGPAHWVKEDDVLVSTSGRRSTVTEVEDRSSFGYFRVMLRDDAGNLFPAELSTNANVVYYRTLANRMLNLGKAVLLNQDDATKDMSANTRAHLAAEYVVAVVEAGGETVDPLIHRDPLIRALTSVAARGEA